MKVIKKKNNNDVLGDKRAIQMLKREVEKAKIELSTNLVTTIVIKDLINGSDFIQFLTRGQFEKINTDLFKMIIGPLQTALEESGLKKNQVDEIILVGGSSRIPKIRQIVKDFFNGKKLNTRINPNEAVCYGAAIYGGIKYGEESNEAKQLIVIDVTPLSLGIETVNGVMNKIIPKGSYIPIKKSKVFTTYQDNQQTVTISVFEGESPLVKDNLQLGQLNISGIPQDEIGALQIEVVFEITFKGILRVSVNDMITGKTQQVDLKNYLGKLSQKEIEKMAREAKEFGEFGEFEECDYLQESGQQLNI